MLKNRKRIVSDALSIGLGRVKMDPTRLADIKEAITKHDLRSLIKDGAIIIRPLIGTSRFRARKRKIQKRKGRRKGEGKRKGKKTARLNGKKAWMNKIRTQRNFLKMLKDKEKITPAVYRNLYLKSKGGFFRSKRHIQLYLEGLKK